MLSYNYPKLVNSKALNLRHIHQLIQKTLRHGATGKTFEVTNPVNGKVVGEVPDMDVNDTQKCIERADKAFDEWKLRTAKERSRILRNWFNLLEENSERIAKIMTQESGKPLVESRGEVAYGNSFVEWFSEEARRILGELIPSPVRTKRILVEKSPIGAVGLITPWNFPHAMITRKASAALAAGCTCVIKPAEDTPLTAVFLVNLAHRAGFPEDVIQLVTSSRENAAAIGELLCKSPQITGISFTGSTAVGRILYKNCAKGIKRLALELGGNAPFIVFDSANIRKAADSAIIAKFRNCGQTCVSANRFLIQRGIYDRFVGKFRERAQQLKMGNSIQEDVQLGPLINRRQFETVSRYVKDAISKGAKVLLGGKPATHLGELFYEPTILDNLTEDMQLYYEEAFGPVASIIKFDTEEEAIKIANSTTRGLASYFYSEDINQIVRVAKLLEAGMVGINEGLISMAEAPFGGIKESGLGREGSIFGVDDYVYIKYMCLGSLEL